TSPTLNALTNCSRIRLIAAAALCAWSKVIPGGGGVSFCAAHGADSTRTAPASTTGHTNLRRNRPWRMGLARARSCFRMAPPFGLQIKSHRYEISKSGATPLDVQEERCRATDRYGRSTVP